MKDFGIKRWICRFQIEFCEPVNPGPPEISWLSHLRPPKDVTCWLRCSTISGATWRNSTPNYRTTDVTEHTFHYRRIVRTESQYRQHWSEPQPCSFIPRIDSQGFHHVLVIHRKFVQFFLTFMNLRQLGRYAISWTNKLLFWNAWLTLPFPLIIIIL